MGVVLVNNLDRMSSLHDALASTMAMDGSRCRGLVDGWRLVPVGCWGAPLGRQRISLRFAGVPRVGYVCFVGYGLPGGRRVLQPYCGSYQGWT
jgi:hypothetical protein